MTAVEIRTTTLEDKHVSMLAEFVLHIWPSTKAKMHASMQQYWSLCNEIAFINEIAMKGR